jgi:transcriptional regulator with XRE-family HTH domain
VLACIHGARRRRLLEDGTTTSSESTTIVLVDASGQRAELAGFLRARRTQLDRASLGFPEGPRRRTRGLRREEVAALSGVSVTWYTWLEQARDVHPSRQVLDALAAALRLTDAEHGYLLSLAGLAVPAPSASRLGQAPPHIQHLLDALPASPAFAITSDWAIVAWNDAYAALYPNVATMPAEDRNLLLAVYTDPFVRRLLVDWDVTSRRFLAEFRAEAGPRLAGPEGRRLVDRLNAASPEFRSAWPRHDIEGFASRRRSFLTPVGTLEFDHHRLVASDQPDLSLVIYTPAGPSIARAVKRLMRRHAAGA